MNIEQLKRDREAGTPEMTNLIELAERVENGRGIDLALDMEVEIATFEPCAAWKSIRPNRAGTKVIYTAGNGYEMTFHAWDWTLARKRGAEKIRQIAELRHNNECNK